MTELLTHTVGEKINKNMNNLQTFDDFLEEAVLWKSDYAENYSSGLYNAKLGSIIMIGIQGQRNKFWGKIDAIDKNGRFVTADGDVFDKNGLLFKSKQHWFSDALKKKLKVSAILKTKAQQLEETMTFVKKSLYADGIMPCKDPKILLEIAALLHRGYPQLEEIVNEK